MIAIEIHLFDYFLGLKTNIYGIFSLSLRSKSIKLKGLKRSFPLFHKKHISKKISTRRMSIEKVDKLQNFFLRSNLSHLR